MRIQNSLQLQVRIFWFVDMENLIPVAFRIIWSKSYSHLLTSDKLLVLDVSHFIFVSWFKRSFQLMKDTCRRFSLTPDSVLKLAFSLSKWALDILEQMKFILYSAKFSRSTILVDWLCWTFHRNIFCRPSSTHVYKNEPYIQGKYFMSLILAVWDESAKTGKIMCLENLPLYCT